MEVTKVGGMVGRRDLKNPTSGEVERRGEERSSLLRRRRSQKWIGRRDLKNPTSGDVGEERSSLLRMVTKVDRKERS